MATRIERMPLSRVPSDVLSLTRPGATSAMKQWVSEAKLGVSEGIAWLVWDDDLDPSGSEHLVGWAAVLDGEFSIYVKPSERRRGIGRMLVEAIGVNRDLLVRPHNRIGEFFFRENGFSL